MDELERVWPDADRRHDALLRCLQDIYLAEGSAPAATRDPHEVTDTELRALEAFSHGLGRTGTADALGVTLETVKTLTVRARRKLRAKDTTHAVAIAIRRGLIS